MENFWGRIWDRDGGMRCKHCGAPIYRDNQSGYYMHCGHFETGKMPDGKNGYYCKPEMWRGYGVTRHTAYPSYPPAPVDPDPVALPFKAQDILEAKEPPMSVEIQLRHEDSRRFHELLHKAGEMHDKKQADYGRSEAPFANIEASEEWGVPAWVGSMIRLNDKVRRLQKPAQGGSLSNEGVLDSLMDIAVYALIAYVMYERDHADS